MNNHVLIAFLILTDWYETTNAKQVGFKARSFVGGYFIKMLEQKLPDN